MIWAIASAVGVFVALAVLGYVTTRPTLVRVEAELPRGFPAEGFSHESFERLLRRHVDATGRVDYEAWHRSPPDRAALESYLAAVAAYSPDTQPSRFPRSSDALAYWMYAYNAFVVQAVLQRWPLHSVTDVKAPLEVVRGLGFFYNLRFVAGGEVLSLYSLEHERILARAKDPRAHFVLNCGSESCPVMRPELPTGDELEPFLQRAAEEFVADPSHVAVDDAARTVTLSKIFDWYEGDFVGDLRRRGLPVEGGVVGYVAAIAPAPLAARLRAARGYRVVFRDYDWALNESREGEARAGAAP